MSESLADTSIGGDFCKSTIGPTLLPHEGQELTPRERKILWVLFQSIGHTWKDLHWAAKDSSTLKSSWLEFIEAKTGTDPSYAAEYSNAVQCIEELRFIYGSECETDDDPLTMEHPLFTKLLLENQIPKGPPLTRIAHAKKYVVDEFIHVNIVASGFKSFGEKGSRGRNYKGYLGGSRFNIRARVRDYDPKEGAE